MKVILLQDVKALGKKGDVVNVSDGYARNAIFPKKLGVEANAKNLNDLKLQNQHADKVAQENYEAALAMAENLKDKKVTVKMKAGEGGRTFGSVSTKEISSSGKRAAWIRTRQEENAAFGANQKLWRCGSSGKTSHKSNRKTCRSCSRIIGRISWRRL